MVGAHAARAKPIGPGRDVSAELELKLERPKLRASGGLPESSTAANVHCRGRTFPFNKFQTAFTTDVDVTASSSDPSTSRLPGKMISLIVGIRQRREQAVARAPVVLVLVPANGTHVGGACVAHQEEAAAGVAAMRRPDAPLASVNTPLLRSRPQCFSLGALLIASATNLAVRTVVAMFQKLNDDEARRTDISRACEACDSEAIDDPQLGAMLFCDHMEHTRVCNAAWHLTCCPQPLQSVPKGKWFCPTHAGTHASFPAFAVVTARRTHEEPISTRTEPVGARGDAHGAVTTAQAALDSATQNGTDLRDSGEASGPSESDEDSESDSDADDGAGLPVWIRLDNPTMGTCSICSERRRLQFSTNYGTTHTVVAVCGRCHSYHEHNDPSCFRFCLILEALFLVTVK